MLQPLLQAVSPHILLQFFLVALEGGCSRRVWQNVALDEFFAVGAVLQALLQVVCGALTFELEGFGLEGAGCVLVSFALALAFS